MSVIERLTAEHVTEQGWQVGTTLENRVAWLLSRYGLGPETKFGTRQQYQIGKYRLDFAWPSRMMAMECDGPFHRMPAGAVRDTGRDAWLRNQGWVVFRVDDTGTEHEIRRQVARVCRIVRAEDPGLWRDK